MRHENFQEMQKLRLQKAQERPLESTLPRVPGHCYPSRWKEAALRKVRNSHEKCNHPLGTDSLPQMENRAEKGPMPGGTKMKKALRYKRQVSKQSRKERQEHLLPGDIRGLISDI